MSGSSDNQSGDQSSDEMMPESEYSHRRCCFFTPSFECWKKMREWSELVAGPRWKTFIRRFGRNRAGGGGNNSAGQGRFGYDPLSYALNFDDGQKTGQVEEAELGYRDFSSRYSAGPGSANSSMDFGRDEPSF